MQKKVILIISLVILVVAGAIYYYTKVSSKPIVIYTPNYRGVEDSSDYKKYKETCQNLSQEQCENNDNCIGQYGSSYCSPGGMCTMDMVFKACGPSGLNSNEIQQIKTECDKINGKFRKDWYAGTICFCEGNQGNLCLENLIQELKLN